MTSRSSEIWRVRALVLSMFVLWLGLSGLVEAQDIGKQIFESKCTACHTIGKGKLIGPDLAGVTLRREQAWLKRQILEPQALLAENDPIAVQLLQDYNNVPMVPLGLSDAEAMEVIAYLKSTEQQAIVASGLPSQYMPTVLVSVVILAALTLMGLGFGRKRVDDQ